jgi:hypothetical protein
MLQRDVVSGRRWNPVIARMPRFRYRRGVRAEPSANLIVFAMPVSCREY